MSANSRWELGDNVITICVWYLYLEFLSTDNRVAVLTRNLVYNTQ